MMIVHSTAPVSEIVDRTIPLMFLVVLFLCDWLFHFGSVVLVDES
jgi:hypothetical protein